MNTKKRLLIYCVLSFLPLYTIVSIWNVVNDKLMFADGMMKDGIVDPVVYVFGVFLMFVPAVANLLTRLITKEGFSDSYLGLTLTGKLRYYVISLLVKPLEGIVTIALMYFIFFRQLPFAQAFPAQDIDTKAAGYLMQLTYSVIVFFPAFGEEWGWRGYMMPKLMELMSKPKAIVVGGIIWGIWHAPLTVSGHNFGIDYPLYPWLGIFLMCAMCVLMNALLTFLTEKTRSVYPASFCHMINNNLGAEIVMMLFGSETLLERINEIPSYQAFLATMPVMVVTGIVSYILLMRDESRGSTHTK